MLKLKVKIKSKLQEFLLLDSLMRCFKIDFHFFSSKTVKKKLVQDIAILFINCIQGFQ